MARNGAGEDQKANWAGRKGRATSNLHTSGNCLGLLPRGVYLLGFVALAACSISSTTLAQTAKVINLLNQNADLVADVKQVCPAPRNYDRVSDYSLLDVDRLDEDFGSATAYIVTATIIRNAITTDGAEAFLFTTPKPNPKRTCVTLLVLATDVGKVRLAPAVRDGDFRAHLPSVVSDEVDRLLAECHANPENARRDYLLTEFLMGSDGTLAMLEGAFNCDSGVMTSISAIDITANGRKIQVAYVKDTIFLLELRK